ncbi:hypothetical protein B0H16DRAFT_1494024 [Mycena metata]|uniref:PPPDE domain-containing protein n=1 Tax=Mycena metata TaxID=1033252 RepID=A0AAD7P064_9AGAR|nr:hypothetical protein B0H16DRAFT_1494024 [Mycena metata]
MSEPEAHKEWKSEKSTRKRVETILKQGLEKGHDEVLKGKLHLEHSLGLGAKPNIIPPGEITINGPPRTVEIGWHPVAGFAGKWFAEKSGLGKMITEKIGSTCPDPTQHWAVLVGDYVHELWMDEHLHVIYMNEKINREEWHTFEVGKTRFSDEALRQAGEMVIEDMRLKPGPLYNLIENNCQNFTTLMIDKIQVGKHREFATALAIYQRAKGAGTTVDADNNPDNDPAQKPETPPEGSVKRAQKVMDENTTKLDNHHSLVSRWKGIFSKD